jgi:DNA invertase Pin-like site-specific DNA recombinase
MKVALYLRISKESSELDNQRLVLQDYCDKMHYEIVGIYADIISGASPKRPEFSRMLSDASKHRFSLLLFYSLDRFSRSGTRDTIRYLQMLDDYNVMYKSFTEQYIDSSGIFKDVIIALLSTLAKQERLRISERVHAGLARARQQGRIGGRPTIDKDKIDKVRQMKLCGKSITNISKALKISRGSVYFYSQ